MVECQALSSEKTSFRGAVMKDHPWTDDAQEALQNICSFFPEIIRDRWQQRLVRTSQRIAVCEGRHSVTSEVFWQAVSEVFPGGYDPIVLKVKDVERLHAEMAAARRQEELDPGSEPVRMIRWGRDNGCEPGMRSNARILAVNASGRKGGNTDVIIDEIMRACSDSGCSTEKLYLIDIDLKPCTGCRACRRTDVPTICTVRDEMTSTVYERLYAADGLIVGFPIYTARENGLMANFMDRWDCLLNPHLSRRMPSGKKAVIVCSWMWPNPHAYDHVIEQMVILLKLHGIETIDVLAVSGTRGKHHGRGIVKHHPDIMEKAYQAGRAFLKFL